MILLENKIAIFNKIVYLETQKKCNEKLLRVREKCNQLILDKEKELSKMKSDLIKKKEDLAKQKSYEMIAKVNEDRRVLELQKDEELLNKLIDELAMKMEKFTETNEYVIFEESRFETVTDDFGSGEYIVSILDEDREKLIPIFEKIAGRKAMKLSFETLPKKLIGGFTISDEGRTYNVDCSLREKVEDSKYEIGKLLHFTLKKAGEKN
ncbi:hypothetical protein [Peptoniphilus mikwangii]|uniref:hypothetical protein n=1 Tax=Peptoniphilus mikwangii TaxID=1354300 RepID=UPI00040FB84C|nr:hypothetical protein [Peptoniphilus mikwangii]